METGNSILEDQRASRSHCGVMRHIGSVIVASSQLMLAERQT
jgi:hypothetical protein